MDYLINKLNKVQWTSFTAHKMTAEGTIDGRNIRLEIGCGFSRIKYSTDVEALSTISPIAVSAVIYIDDVHAGREDIHTLADIEILRDWYLTTKNSIEDAQREARDSAWDQAKEIFLAL